MLRAGHAAPTRKCQGDVPLLPRAVRHCDARSGPCSHPCSGGSRLRAPESRITRRPASQSLLTFRGKSPRKGRSGTIWLTQTRRRCRPGVRRLAVAAGLASPRLSLLGVWILCADLCVAALYRSLVIHFLVCLCDYLSIICLYKST